MKASISDPLNHACARWERTEGDRYIVLDKKLILQYIKPGTMNYVLGTHGKITALVCSSETD